MEKAVKKLRERRKKRGRRKDLKRNARQICVKGGLPCHGTKTGYWNEVPTLKKSLVEQLRKAIDGGQSRRQNSRKTHPARRGAEGVINLSKDKTYSHCRETVNRRRCGEKGKERKGHGG